MINFFSKHALYMCIYNKVKCLVVTKPFNWDLFKNIHFDALILNLRHRLIFVLFTPDNKTILTSSNQELNSPALWTTVTNAAIFYTDIIEFMILICYAEKVFFVVPIHLLWIRKVFPHNEINIRCCILLKSPILSD